jgi:hypothetical protein
MSKGSRRKKEKKVHTNKYASDKKAESGKITRTIDVGKKQIARGERKKRKVAIGEYSTQGLVFGQAPLTRKERKKRRLAKQREGGNSSGVRSHFHNNSDIFGGRSMAFGSSYLDRNPQRTRTPSIDSSNFTLTDERALSRSLPRTPEPEIEYTKAFVFEKRSEGCRISSIEFGTLIDSVVHVSGDMPYDRINTKHNTYPSLDEFEDWCSGDPRTKPEAAAIRTLIQSNLVTKTLSVEAKGTDSEADQIKETYLLSFDAPNDYAVNARNEGCAIVNVDCDTFIGETEITISAADGQIYTSFEKAESFNKRDRDFLKELAAVKSMIADRGGKIF